MSFLLNDVHPVTHYEDTKCNEKCRNWSGLGGLGVTQCHRQHNYSSAYDFLFNLLAHCCVNIDGRESKGPFFVAYQNLPGIGVWYVNMVVT